MTSKIGVKFVWILGLCSFYLAHLGISDFEVGSCSRLCQRDPNEKYYDTSINKECSCSPTCKSYQDCCYDSQFRNTVQNIPQALCLPIFGQRGSYKAILQCPSGTEGSPNACEECLGRLPPVTSKSSGFTYGNVHCAVCNNDTSDLVYWDVELKCCPEHEDDLESLSQRRIVYQDGYLLSVDPRTDIRLEKCICRYIARDGDYNFLKSLTLCSYDPYIRCPSTWNNETVRHLCNSFFEPVSDPLEKYLYRNAYCAQCNDRNLSSVRCYDYDDSNKGRPFPFSYLFVGIYMPPRECFPPNCCAGHRYDLRTKSCRELDQI